MGYTSANQCPLLLDRPGTSPTRARLRGCQRAGSRRPKRFTLGPRKRLSTRGAQAERKFRRVTANTSKDIFMLSLDVTPFSGIAILSCFHHEKRHYRLPDRPVHDFYLLDSPTGSTSSRSPMTERSSWLSSIVLDERIFPGDSWRMLDPGIPGERSQP